MIQRTLDGYRIGAIAKQPTSLSVQKIPQRRRSFKDALNNLSGRSSLFDAIKTRYEREKQIMLKASSVAPVGHVSIIGNTSASRKTSPGNTHTMPLTTVQEPHRGRTIDIYA